jgi:hypothetical protein
MGKELKSKGNIRHGNNRRENGSLDMEMFNMEITARKRVHSVFDK